METGQPWAHFDTIIESHRVKDLKTAEARAAWSPNKIALVDLALLLAVTGVAVGVTMTQLRDDGSDREPLPVFTGKDGLRAAVEEYIAGNLTAISHPIGSWDVSNVTDFSRLFAAQSEDDPFVHFNADISGWQTSQVANMSGLFSNAISFNQALGNWDTSAVTDMSGGFQGAESFNQSIEEWDTSSVIDMSSLFNGASAFNSPLALWDTSSVRDMSMMCTSAESFNRGLCCWNV